MEKFLEQLPEQLELLRAALAARDAERLAMLAHTLKGTGGTVGFPAFTAPAQSLELAAKAGDWAQAITALNTLTDLSQRVVGDPAPAHA